MILKGINNVVLCDPLFPHNSLSVWREQTRASRSPAADLSLLPLPLVDIQCLCGATIYITGQHNTRLLAFMSFCMCSLSVHHRFRQKGAYGSEPAIFFWPSAQSCSQGQCCESYLNIKYNTVGMSTCPSTRRQDFGRLGLW